MAARGNTKDFIRAACARACADAGNVPLRLKADELPPVYTQVPTPATIRKNANDFYGQPIHGFCQQQTYNIYYSHGVFCIEPLPAGSFVLDDLDHSGRDTSQLVARLRKANCDVCGATLDKRVLVLTEPARIRHASCHTTPTQGASS